MTPEQQALSDDLQARTDEFLRHGGTITRLNYAGVPIDDEYGRPVHVPARAEPPTETAKEWCERVAAQPLPQLRKRIDPPDTTPEQDAEFAEFLREVLIPEPEQPCIITRLRALRSDAQRTLEQLNRLVEAA